MYAFIKAHRTARHEEGPINIYRQTKGINLEVGQPQDRMKTITKESKSLKGEEQKELI